MTINENGDKLNRGSKGMTVLEFVNLLKERGCYYSPEEGHIVSKGGKLKGKLTRNGYYTIMAQKDGEHYTFCEHRVVWWWHHPETDESLVIDHLDCDRGNNHIENLEAVSQKENTRRTAERGRTNPAVGERSGKTNLTNRDAKTIRYMAANGYKRKDISELIVKDRAKHALVTVNRIIERTRFGNVPDASEIWEVYPEIVMATARVDLPREEQIKNALMGLSGEVGEVVDLFKKHFYQGHPLDVSHVAEELGDALYYWTWLAVLCMGMDEAEIMLQNMDKLTRRYPNGFSAERSINRQEGDI